MALDLRYIAYTISGEKYLQPVIVDDELWAQIYAYTGNTQIADSGTVNNILTAEQTIDNFFGSILWQSLLKCPCCLPTTRDNIPRLNDIQTFFPNVKFIHSADSDYNTISGVPMYDMNNRKIIDYNVFWTYTQTSTYNTYQSFSRGGTWNSGSAARQSSVPYTNSFYRYTGSDVTRFTALFYVAKSSQIVDNVITGLQSYDAANSFMTIGVRVTAGAGAGNYRAQIYGGYQAGLENTNEALKYITNINLLNGTPVNKYESDPYQREGGTSGTGGGTGTFDGSTAKVNFQAGTPTAGAGASGFIKLFNPTAANLSALAAYLWGTFDISSYKSIYNNPIDCIVALTVVPVQPATGAAATISLGNIASDVSAPIITNQFVIFDCGSLDIQEYWGAYLDYDPYTKCEIYLPYIGVQDIDINDIQGKTIQLKYYIDVLSGACVAMLKCADDILYNWSGQCGAEVPITATSFGSAFQTALSVGNAIGETIVNAMSGIPQNISQVATSVFNGARSKVHKSGSIGSMAGHMGIQKPYLIITRPVQSVPERLNDMVGYPSNITATLSDLQGYTEIDVIYPANIPATSAEMDEIVQLLKDGVIL